MMGDRLIFSINNQYPISNIFGNLYISKTVCTTAKKNIIFPKHEMFSFKK